MHNGVGTIIHATSPTTTTTKMGMVTEGSGSMEMAVMRSLHEVLHATVFQIIGMATQGKGRHL